MCVCAHTFLSRLRTKGKHHGISYLGNHPPKTCRFQLLEQQSPRATGSVLQLCISHTDHPLLRDTSPGRGAGRGAGPGVLLSLQALPGPFHIQPPPSEACQVAMATKQLLH